MTIRAATFEDIPVLRSLAERIWREYYPAVIGAEQIEFMLARMYSEQTMREEMHAGIAWDIAEEDAAAIGFASCGLEADGRVKLHKLYILPALHGRGHGQRLLAHVLEKARSLGGRELWLQVNKRNHRAIAAYRKAGFHIAKEAVFDIGGGFVMDDYLMALAL